MMSLHTSKKTALLQLSNCISSSSISSIKELSDGLFFQNTINSTFADFLDVTCNYNNVPIDSLDNKNEFNGDILNVTTIKSEDTDTESEKVENCVPNSVAKPAECLDGNNKDALQRFKYAQRFIDERYNLKSEEVISYCQCIKTNELELAKVTIFILSEIVKHFVFVNKDHLQTLSHLDIKVQEDLEECFCLFISERDKISKHDVERILCNHANYKAPCSPKRNSFVTPRRHCLSKYRRSFSTATPSNEEVFTNSPLKSFFESPVFKKEDIILKEKEIEKTRKILHEEEMKSEDLQHELHEVKQNLQQKEKEIIKLKNYIAELNEDCQKTLNGECKNDSCKEERKKYEEERKRLEGRMKFLYDEVTSLHCQIVDLRQLEKSPKPPRMEKSPLQVENEKSPSQVENEESPTQVENETSPTQVENETSPPEFKKEKSPPQVENEKCPPQVKKEESPQQVKKDEKLGLTQMSYFEVGFRAKSSHMHFLEDELNQTKQRLKDTREDLSDAKKTVLMYKSKLAEAEATKQPQSPVLEENIGGIIDEESRILKSKLSKAELQIEELKKELECQKELIEQNQVFSAENSVAMAMPELLHMSVIPEREKLRNSVKHSENVKELNHLHDECYVFDNSGVASKQSVTSLPWEVNPVTESSAVLWDRYDSQGENENTFATDCIDVNLGLGIPENTDKTSCVDVVSENSDKRDCTNDDNLHIPENADMFENLTVNAVLNVLKRLPANGSLKNVLQMVLENVKPEHMPKMSTTNGSNGYDVQMLVLVLLQKLTEIFSVSTTSHYNLQDKNCLKSNTIHSGNENDVMESDELMYQMNEIVKKCSIQLKEKEEEIDKLKTENNSLTKKNKESSRKNYEKRMMINDLRRTSEDFETRFKEKMEKYSELEKVLKDLKLKGKKQIKELSALLQYEKIQSAAMKKKHETATILLKKEINKLRQQKEILTNEIKNHVCVINAVEENKETSSKTESTFPWENIKIKEQNFNQKSESVFPEFYSTSLQDTGNESILSGALRNKPNLHFESLDEEGFLNQSSLADIKKDYQEDRVEELLRRNSTLPIHLQTSYPVEANLPLSNESLYVKNNEKVKYRNLNERLQNDNEFNNKKRKFADIESEMESRNVTPIRKMKRTFKTPSSLKKLLQFSRSQRPSYVKPKP